MNSFLQKYDLVGRFLLILFLTLFVLANICSRSSAWADPTSNGDNSWQIVTDGQKITSSEGAVRIQKSIMPTGTENVFQIHVTVDKKASMSTLFDSSTFMLTTSNSGKWHLGDIVTGKIGGNKSEVYEKGAGSAGDHIYEVTINLHDENGTIISTYSDVRYGASPNCSQGTFFMTLPGIDGHIVAGKSVSLGTGHQGDAIVVDLYQNNFHFDIQFEVLLNEGSTGEADYFTDTMGEGIHLVSIDSSDGTAEIISDTELSWTPVEKTGVEAVFTGPNPLVGWYNNIAEMVYTVRLDPDVSGGVPPAAASKIYDTNSSASLGYHKADLYNGSVISTGTVDPTTPQVRALLYDLELKKVNEQGVGIPGAIFTLCDENGESLGITTTSMNDGTAKFHNLQYGTYSVKETQAPSGYMMGDITTVGPYDLCWTTNSGGLTQDHGSGHDADWTSDVANAIISGAMPELVNKRAMSLTIHKTDNATPPKPLEGVRFELLGENNEHAQVFSDPECTEPVLADLPTDKDGNINYYGLKPGIYYLHETAALPDYKPLENNVRIKITSDTSGFHIFYYDTEEEGTVDENLHAQLDIQNIPRPSLLVVKVDGTSAHNPLAGAEFTLSASGKFPLVDTSAIDPSITQVGSISCPTGLAVSKFEALDEATYSFQETFVPSGYEITSESHTIEVANGAILFDGTPCNTVTIGTGENAKIYHYLVVQNNEMPSLPVTGTCTPFVMYLVGIGLLFFVGFTLLRKNPFEGERRCKVQGKHVR